VADHPLDDLDLIGALVDLDDDDLHAAGVARARRVEVGGGGLASQPSCPAPEIRGLYRRIQALRDTSPRRRADGS
jgi:hypothetical protein